MKKFKSLTVALALTSALLFLGGCSDTQSSNQKDQTQQASEMKLYRGMGQTPVFRVGPGTDPLNQLYSLTYVTASALFDQDGKVLDVYFDALEVMSPNDEEHVGVPKFSGWPTQPGYKVDGNTEDSAKKEVADWKTKRERGDAAYGMNWSEQFAVFQDFFKGKTVAEIEAWYAKNTSDLNGRPLKADSSKPEDQAKYAKLTEEEKKALADVTSGATISLKDAHGDYVGALKEAFENKTEITIPVK